MSVLLLFLSSAIAFAQVNVCVLGNATSSKEKRTLQLLTEQMQTCKPCKVLPLSIQPESGKPHPATVVAKINEAKAKCEILQLNWNRAFAPDWMPVIEALQNASREARLIVGAAGNPEGKSKSVRLSGTILGRLQQDIFIIGELDKNGKLEPKSFQGPGLFTALKPPKGAAGSANSAALFSAALATKFAERTPDLWRIRLSNNKAATKKEWPSLAEIFEDAGLKAH